MAVDGKSVHFENPPLTEVVFGVWISGLNLDIVHYGQFYDLIKKDFPRTSLVNPLPPPGEIGTQQAAFKLLAKPDLPRIWFESADSAYILQLQPDRLILNWRKQHKASNSYPHFDSFYKKFISEWGRFQEFAAKMGLGVPRVVGFELTYINQLIAERDWNAPKDLSKFFRHMQWLADLNNPLALGLDLVFSAGEFSVRNTVKRGQLKDSGKDVFVVEFGIFHHLKSKDDLPAVASKANDALVREFLSLSTEHARKAWGLK